MFSILNRRDFFKLSILSIAYSSIPGLSYTKDTEALKRKISDLISAPPMGWNSFNSYGVYLHEDAALANIEEMAKTYLPYGYEYFVIDGGWFGEYKLIPGTRYPDEKHASDVHINENGLVQPSKCYFPNGLKRLIDHAHMLGLKFGIHLMRGIPRKAVELNLPVKGTKFHARDIADVNSTCVWCHYNYGVDMKKPGAQEYYNSLVNQLADWDLDFIKADDLIPYPLEIIGFANAIENCKRDIVFSLSPGGHVKFSHLPYYQRANMVRVTGDIWEREQDFDKAFNGWEQFQGTSYKGFYPDLDMIPFGQLMLMTPGEMYKKSDDARLAGHGFKRQCQMTREQQYTFITVRALAASPLFIGGDLPTMDDFSKKLLLNKEMLACNQNGVMGFQVYKKDNVEVWLTPHKNEPGKGWLGIFNRNKNDVNVSLSNKELALAVNKKYQFYDIWGNKNFELNGKEKVFSISADGVKFLKFEQV